MVTISDQGEPTEFERFLAARRASRSSAAQELQRIRGERVRRRAELQANVDAIDREFGGSLSILEHLQRTRLQSEQRAKIDRETADPGLRHIYALDHEGVIRPQQAAENDRADYFRARMTDSAADAIASALPGIRVNRAGGWTIYTRPNGHLGLFGEREVLRCSAERVFAANSGHEATYASLIAARERYSPPYRIVGSPAFVDRAQRIARDLGMKLETAETAAPTSTEPPAANEAVRVDAAAERVSSSNDEDRPVAPVASAVEVKNDDPVWDNAKKLSGARYVISAPFTTKGFSGTVVDVVRGYFGKKDAAVIQTSSFAVTVVPVASDELAIGEQVVFEACPEGGWAVSSRTPAATIVEPGRTANGAGLEMIEGDEPVAHENDVAEDGAIVDETIVDEATPGHEPPARGLGRHRG